MSRVIAVLACGFSVAACSASMPSLNFLSSSPSTEALRIESKPPGAEAKTSSGQSCRTPCELSVQPSGEVSVRLALSGYQPQTVSVRPDGSAQGVLAPNPIFVEFQPAAAKKPVHHKKNTPVASTSKAKPAPTTEVAAAPAGTPEPPPPAETAASR
jgi:hypothetical protein